MKKLLIFLFLFTYAYSLDGQTNNTKEGFYNIGFGAIFGGFGAVINKKKDQKVLDVFVKGMGQGALGGYLIFESKRLIGRFGETQNYSYVWPSRLINSAGNSIIENAASNRNFWERWHLNIGFNRIEILTTEKLKLRYKFMPFSFGTFVRNYSKGRMDITKTLKTGIFVFNSSENVSVDGYSNILLDGSTFGNSIVLYGNPISDKEDILSHEIIHVYQNESFVVFNPYLERPIENLIPKKVVATKFWSHIYLDFNTIYFNGAYQIDATFNDDYFKRFFEQEAYFYQKK